MTSLVQLLFDGLVGGAIYALIALGITLVYGLTKIIHFAVGEMVTFGAFLALTFLGLTGGNYVIALLSAIVGVSLLGLVTERTMFRFTFDSPLSGFIVSLGLILVLQGVIVEIWTSGSQSARPAVGGAIDISGVSLRYQSMINLALAAVILGSFYLILRRTKFGQALRATSDDREAALLMGVPIRTIAMTTFVIASALAGVAGWIVLTMGTVSPFVGTSYVLRGFAVALIGGLGSVSGAVIAGVGLGVVENLAIGFLPPGWTDVYVFALVVVVLLIRPTGLRAGAEGAHL